MIIGMVHHLISDSRLKNSANKQRIWDSKTKFHQVILRTSESSSFADCKQTGPWCLCLTSLIFLPFIPMPQQWGLKLAAQQKTDK